MEVVSKWVDDISLKKYVSPCVLSLSVPSYQKVTEPENAAKQSFTSEKMPLESTLPPYLHQS